jgi:hypothetical protein
MKNIKKKIWEDMMRRFAVLICILFSILFACNNRGTYNQEISRYMIELKKEKMSCLFDTLYKYLPADEERKNYFAQRGATEYLDKIKRYDQPYSIVYNKKNFYIDFTLLANKDNSRTFYLNIAGESEFVDSFVKEINTSCKAEKIKKDQTEDEK